MLLHACAAFYGGSIMLRQTLLLIFHASTGSDLPELDSETTRAWPPVSPTVIAAEGSRAVVESWSRRALLGMLGLQVLPFSTRHLSDSQSESL